jgi:ribosomal protein L3 glutamine methyltransferase
MSGAPGASSFAEAAAHLRSVRDLLRFAVTRFEEAELSFGHGSDNAYDEAAHLILHTLHLPLQRLEPFLDAALLPGEVRAVLHVLERRVTQRLPAAYITQEAWLGDYRFHVDERVIVPRSHIAELIDEGFSAWLPDPDAVTDALDLCTGSGCLAILLALAFPAARVDAVDLSAEALEVARINVEDYGLEDRVALVQSDLFAGLAGRRYPLIVSNPPYVDAEAMRNLPPEYRREPALALAAGADGMEVVRRILAQAHRHLLPGGILVVEVGSGRAAVEAAFPKLEPTWLSTRAGDDLVFLLERDQLT